MICLTRDFWVDPNTIINAKSWSEKELVITYRDHSFKIIETNSQAEKTTVLWVLERILKRRQQLDELR